MPRTCKSVTVPATKPLFPAICFVMLHVGLAACVWAQDAQPTNPGESWTATKQISIDNTNPLRTTESHSKSGNRSVDKVRTEVLGPDGHYRPETDSETETVQIDATTSRTTVRKYRWDGNGRKSLVEVTEEEARTSSGGDLHVARSTSSTDLNGNLQPVQREVADTKKTSSNAQETRTTVYLSDGNGGFAPSRQTKEVQERSDEHSIQVKKTTLLPDANGGWVVSEVSEKTVKEDGETQTSEESVSRPDLEGRLSEVARTVGEETRNAAGEKSSKVETYSVQVFGSAVDGKLHLSQRVTTVEKNDPETKVTEQQVEQPNAGNPSDGLQVNGKNQYTVKYAASGTQQTRTVQVRNAGGGFTVFSAQAQKSDQVPAQPAPAVSSDTSK